MFARRLAERAVVAETRAGVQITIVGKRSVGTVMLSIVVAGFWRRSHRSGSAAPMSSARWWYCSGGALWGAIVASAITAILWMVAGKEWIEARPGTLSVRRQLFGLGVTHRFDAVRLRNFRYVAGPPDEDGSIPSSGTLAFDVGAKTHRLVSALTESEVKGLIELLGRHLRLGPR
jgi:hypothetical protein